VDDKELMNRTEAAERLDQIRDWMAQTRQYEGLSSLAVCMAGLAACLGGVLLALDVLPLERKQAFLAVWGGVFAFALLCNLCLIIVKARRNGVAWWGRLSRTVLYAVAPGVAGGGVVTFALVHAGAVDLLPCVWMVMYGCTLLAVRFFTPTSVGLIGMLFLTTGALVLVLFPGPEALHPAVMAAPFGGYHLLFGTLLRRRQPSARRRPEGESA
jgi:hypothetical protein